MPNNTLKRQLKVLTIPVFIEMALVMLLSELAERVGLTLANLSILKTGKAKAIRFTTLEAICRELGCQPGDILEYQQ
jgi:putative transcriptional regulator